MQSVGHIWEIKGPVDFHDDIEIPKKYIVIIINKIYFGYETHEKRRKY